MSTEERKKAGTLTQSASKVDDEFSSEEDQLLDAMAMCRHGWGRLYVWSCCLYCTAVFDKLGGISRCRFTILLECGRDQLWVTQGKAAPSPKPDPPGPSQTDSLWGPGRGPFDALLDGGAATPTVPTVESIVDFEAVRVMSSPAMLSPATHPRVTGTSRVQAGPRILQQGAGRWHAVPVTILSSSCHRFGVQEYLVLDGFVSRHIQVKRDVSKAYKCVGVFVWCLGECPQSVTMVLVCVCVSGSWPSLKPIRNALRRCTFAALSCWRR